MFGTVSLRIFACFFLFYLGRGLGWILPCDLEGFQKCWSGPFVLGKRKNHIMVVKGMDLLMNFYPWARFSILYLVSIEWWTKSFDGEMVGNHHFWIHFQLVLWGNFHRYRHVTIHRFMEKVKATNKRKRHMKFVIHISSMLGIWVFCRFWDHRWRRGGSGGPEGPSCWRFLVQLSSNGLMSEKGGGLISILGEKTT